MGTFLAEFELYVMLAIAQLGDGAYGAAMRKEIEVRTGRPVSIGALYATLSRLTAKGYVEERGPGAPTGERGRPRKYCQLTPAGDAALRHSTRMLGRMMEGLPLTSEGGT